MLFELKIPLVSGLCKCNAISAVKQILKWPENVDVVPCYCPGFYSTQKARSKV